MEEPPPDDKESTEDAYKSRLHNARWSSIGIQIGVSVGGGALVGMWLDKKFNTGSTFVLIGIFVGLTAVSIDIYQLLKDTQNNS